MKTTPQSCITVILLLLCFCTYAQSYQSTYGSAYAGSTGIRNNPAASVNSAFTWDLTLFTAQARVSTNTMYMRNDSILFNNEYKNRFLHNNIDVSLLNFLYKPNNNQAFSFNLRARSYNHVRALPLSSNDSITTINDFLRQNRNTPFMEGFFTHSGWIQADLNYSQVLHEDSRSRLTGGATVQIMKNISGAFGRISKLTYAESVFPPDTIYTLTGGGGNFGYSSNYDETSSGTSSTMKDFLKGTKMGLGLSLGIEYLVYAEKQSQYQQNNPLNYTWKIGVSLMDLGASRYTSSEFSSQFRNVNPNITGTTIDNKFTNIETGRQLRDSLATIFATAEALPNTFKIGSPTRLIINVDRSLGNNLFMNADLNVNLHGTSNYGRLLTRELNLLTITPRWETLNWGFYLPVQFNSQKQFHVGAALKAGPLVVGIQNLQWARGIKNLSGGGYVMLSIHPFNKQKVISKLDCPE
jgi:hypothetical protein